MKDKLLIFLYYISLVPLAASAGERGDFLILQQPGLFGLLNGYEQPFDAAEKSAMGEGLPLQIVDRNATLGDQITKAYKVSVNGETAFILKKASGELVTSAPEALRFSMETYKNCTIVDDTVEIIAERAVASYRRFNQRSDRSWLSTGTVAHRLFLYQGLTYSSILSAGQKSFSWVEFRSGTGWKKQHAAVTQSVQSSTPSFDVFPEVEARFERINRLYADYFTYFNTMTGQQKSIPAWQCSRQKDGSIRCVLTG
ncbi:MAG: hypothetical protein JW795_18430, partial [Chitinivibrionales bacterium]|nr:hypothetical protein [Chitinivibrionales bacterium]